MSQMRLTVVDDSIMGTPVSVDCTVEFERCPHDRFSVTLDQMWVLHEMTYDGKVFSYADDSLENVAFVMLARRIVNKHRQEVCEMIIERINGRQAA